MNRNEFMEKYPVRLQELITSPSVFRETLLSTKDLPYPSIYHLRDICEYANYTYGALRTSLSRLIKNNDLDFFYDENKIKRFRLTKIQQDVSKALMLDIGDAKDFTIAIFSFATEQEKQRRDARFLLQGCGFKLFAQNCYIRRKIKREFLESSLKEYGLINNVFLLDCLEPGTDEFKNRLISQFEIDKMAELTNAFLTDLNDFLTEELTAEEYARRILYAGPVYYHICYENEIPIPETYFPENYRMKELKVFFQSIPEDRWTEFIAYYMAIEEKGKKR